jgi:S1-C subfamily serine protease
MRSSAMLKLAGMTCAVLGVAAIGVAMAPAALAQADQRPRELYTYSFGSGLGATIRDVGEADVTRAKLSSATGAVLDNVQASGPAGRAGFKTGDVVLSFDNENVRSARHLQRLIEETPNGREVAVIVMRAGERVTLKMTLESRFGAYTYSYAPFEFTNLNNFNNLRELQGNLGQLDRLRDNFTFTMPEAYFRDASGRLSLFTDRRLRLGVGVQEVTAQLGEYFGTSGGVLVTEVDDNSSGKAAGLRAGDVITKVNDQAIRSLQDLRRVLGNASGEIALTVMRDRKEQTLKVKLQDDEPTPGRTIRR